MKFTLSWLKDHLNTHCNLEEIATKLTSIGLEVEEAINKKSDFIISKIVEIKPHPDANSLNVCIVDNSVETLQIVCGASNVTVDMNVVLATVGSVIPSTNTIIKKSKIRGVTSNGMLCSAHELGFGDDHDGIMGLSGDVTIGTDFFKSDPVIEIAITPNRGDCLGVRGIARDLAAAGLGTLTPLKIPHINFSNIKSPITVRVDDAKNISCFIGCYIQGVKNGTSPPWMQERLQAVGIEPISTLVDIANYLTLTFNRPMHVYDADKLCGGLIIRSAKKGEVLKALNGKDYELDNDITVIADEREVQAIAGIIGGMNSACLIETSNVFLEVALFDSIATGMSSRKLWITTSASYRFERGLDNKFILDGAKIIIEMITSLCGGQPCEPIVINNIPEEQKKNPFNVQKLNNISGCSIDEQNARNILEKLGFTIEKNNISPPSWRHDIDGEADIAEEILRIDGYDNIPSTPLPDMVRKDNFKMSSLNCGLLLVRGMYEVITWSFMDSKNVMNKEQDLIRIKNPISENLDVMRPSIIPNLIEVMLGNFARDEIGVAIFEIGPIYDNDKEEEIIAGLRSGFTSKKNIYGTGQEYDIFDAKADVLGILRQYNIDSPQLIKNTPRYYHPGRSGCFTLGKTVLAYFGELLEQHQYRVITFEIFIERIPQIKKKVREKDFSIYQAVNRDFAFVVKEEVTADEILQAIRISNKTIIKEIDVFDIYRGKDIGEDNKSVAISVKLQAADRTLNNHDLESVHTKIIENVRSRVSGTLRKDYKI